MATSCRPRADFICGNCGKNMLQAFYACTHGSEVKTCGDCSHAIEMQWFRDNDKAMVYRPSDLRRGEVVKTWPGRPLGVILSVGAIHPFSRKSHWGPKRYCRIRIDADGSIWGGYLGEGLASSVKLLERIPKEKARAQAIAKRYQMQSGESREAYLRRARDWARRELNRLLDTWEYRHCHISHAVAKALSNCEKRFPDLGTCGLEGDCEANGEGHFDIQYLNAGDTYDLTICYYKNRFIIDSWGDLYERSPAYRRASRMNA